MTRSLRHTIWLGLEKGGHHPAERRVAVWVLVIVILASVAAVFVETVPALDPVVYAAAEIVRAAAAVLFVVEYALRLWTAPEFERAAPAAQSRLRYALSFLGVIDLLVVVPYLLGVLDVIPAGWAGLFSLLALCKIARYAPALALVGAVLRAEARTLFAALLVMLVLLVLVSGLMYLIEHEAQPTRFSSIPATMWWGIVTIASVGYGDMVPVTAAGRVVGGMFIVLGLATFAVPAGILATGFASEIRKRDFLVTWQAVARVPLFEALDASRVAAIARLLKPQIVPADTVIVRKDEPADAMFFIMSGEVEVEIDPDPVRLDAGEYFGEIALLRDTNRTATVRSVTECRVLGLEARDFRRLMDEIPMLKQAVERVASDREAG